MDNQTYKLLNKLIINQLELQDSKEKYIAECHEKYNNCKHFLIKSGFEEEGKYFLYGCIKCGLDTKSMDYINGMFYDDYAQPMKAYFEAGNTIDGYKSDLEFTESYYPFKELKQSFEIGKELYKKISREESGISNTKLEKLLRKEKNKINNDNLGYLRSRKGK